MGDRHFDGKKTGNQYDLKIMRFCINQRYTEVKFQTRKDFKELRLSYLEEMIFVAEFSFQLPKISQILTFEIAWNTLIF